MKLTLTLIPLLLLVSACNPAAQDPKAVAQQYWQAMVDGDTELANSLVSADSQTEQQNYLQSLQQSGNKITQVALDDQHISVVTTINPDAKRPYKDRPFETILVLEQGRWKIDLTETRIPPERSDTEKQLDELSEKLSRSVDDNIGEMEQVVSEGMELLNEILRDGSKDMGDSFLKGMQELKDAMRESVEKMKQRRRQQSEDNKPAHDDTGEGVI